MNNYYEATYILDIQGKEEGVKEAIDQIKTQIEKLGGEVKGTQRMDRRKFERVAQKIDAGYYLGFNFLLDSSKLSSLQEELDHDKKMFCQFYLKKKLVEEAVAA